MFHISIFLSTTAQAHDFTDMEAHSLTLAFTWLPHVLCLSFSGAWVPPPTLFLQNQVGARDATLENPRSNVTCFGFTKFENDMISEHIV